MFRRVVRQYITYAFFVTILLYHSIQILQPDKIDKNILSILNIVEWAILIFITLTGLRIPYLHKKILGEDYIGGEYVGETMYIENDYIVDKEKKGRKFKCKIEQTLTEMNIYGTSSTIDKEGYDTSWTGYFYKETNKRFFFALEIDYGKIEYGVLELIFNDSSTDEWIGFYYSGDQNSKNQKIIFRRKK